MNIRTMFKNNIDFINRLPALDLGDSDISLILAGMGRSGTTWVGNIINYNNKYRVLFEPFWSGKVKEAEGFDYPLYLSPDCNNMIYAHQAKIILAGKVRNNWIDRDNKRLFYRHRMLKDIRCNLMIGWLRNVANNPPIVLTVRHPLQVAFSWLKLGWGKNFDIILSQKSLLEDFPVISHAKEKIDQHDFFEKIVFLWCVFHLTPSEHLKKSDACTIYYENLITEPGREIAKLFQYLNHPVDMKKIKNILGTNSSTNFLRRDLGKDNTLNGWKEEFSKKQIDRANYILAMFGMENIYDSKGLPKSTHIFKN